MYSSSRPLFIRKSYSVFSRLVRNISYITALQATIQLHRGISHAALAGKLNEIVILLPDANLIQVLQFVVSILDTWQYLAEDSRNRIKTFVRNLPDEGEIFGLSWAFSVKDLEAEAIIRLQQVTLYQRLLVISLMLRNNMHLEIVSKAVSFYVNSENYADANSIGTQLIIPLAKNLSTQQVEQIVRACAENDQIKYSYQRVTVLQSIRDCKIIPIDQFNLLLGHYGIDDIPPLVV